MNALYKIYRQSNPFAEGTTVPLFHRTDATGFFPYHTFPANEKREEDVLPVQFCICRAYCGLESLIPFTKKSGKHITKTRKEKK